MPTHLILLRPHGLLISAVLAALVLTGCHQPAESPPAQTRPILNVKVETATLAARPTTETAIGTVRPRLQATLEAKVSGRIAQLPVHLGQTVKQGDLIAALNVQEIQAKLDQARAMHRQAEQNLQRYTTLLQQEAVTQAEFDAVQARQRVTEAAVNEARTMLDYATVVAPFDGTITRKFANVGDLASPGRPLVSLESTAHYQFVADVPESLISQLHVGQELPVTLPAIGRHPRGTIAEIAPAADPGSRTFRVKLDLPATKDLRSGQFGRAALTIDGTKTLQVPVTAVTERGQLQMVFVATNGTAHLRLVKTGRRMGDQVEILSGLNPGETVIVGHPESLRDGQPVRPSAGS